MVFDVVAELQVNKVQKDVRAHMAFHFRTLLRRSCLLEATIGVIGCESNKAPVCNYRDCDMLCLSNECDGMKGQEKRGS